MSANDLKQANEKWERHYSTTIDKTTYKVSFSPTNVVFHYNKTLYEKYLQQRSDFKRFRVIPFEMHVRKNKIFEHEKLDKMSLERMSKVNKKEDGP